MELCSRVLNPGFTTDSGVATFIQNSPGSRVFANVYYFEGALSMTTSFKSVNPMYRALPHRRPPLRAPKFRTSRLHGWVHRVQSLFPTLNNSKTSQAAAASMHQLLISRSTTEAAVSNACVFMFATLFAVASLFRASSLRGHLIDHGAAHLAIHTGRGFGTASTVCCLTSVLCGVHRRF